MGRKYILAAVAAIGLTTTIFSCSKSSSTSAGAVAQSLYVAAGQCYSGDGITTYTPTTASRAVTKWATDSGVSQGVFTDLNLASNVSVGAVPQSIIDKGDYILMLTENASSVGDRKIFKISKADTSTYVTYANDTTAFTPTVGHVTRSMAMDVDGTITFSKSLFAERLNSIGARIAKGGANPWVNPAAPTSPCFTAAATQITQLALMTPFTNMNQGKLIYIHSGNTAAVNRIGIVQRTGLTSGTVADCAGSNPVGGLSTVAHANAPNLSGSLTFLGTGASPTSMVYIPTPAPAVTAGKLIVSYSGSVNTAFDNSLNFNYGIVMWDITETSDTVATVTNPVILWRDESIVWAPSAMAYDASTSSLYVAVGASPGSVNLTTQNFGYNIEKFTLNTTTPLMTRIATSNQPFIKGNAYTKCISAMSIGQ